MAVLTPTWLTSSDRIIGKLHPQFPDTVNAGVISLNTALLVEHEQTGFHSARRTGLSGEIDTFSGNGVARTITLTNAGLTPKKVFVWEDLYTNLLTNPNFTSDTAGWTAGGGSIASVAGGQDGNCLEVTDAGGGATLAYQNISGLSSGQIYTISVWVKSGTSGDEAFQVYFDGGASISGTTSSVWTQYTVQYTYTGVSNYFNVQKNTLTAGTMLFDTLAVYPVGNAPTRIDNMTSDKAQPSRYYTNAWEADLIDNEQAGSFDVGDTGINTSGVTNYYCVLGIDEDTTVTGDAGAGSDPTWIPSGTVYRMIADGTATISSGNYGNNVASEMWTLWLEEHDNTGAHTITLQHKRIETISWSGNDADDRDIPCAITDLDIDYIEVYEDGMPVASKSTDMSGDNTKDEDAAAFAADLIQDITTNGEFTVGTGLNASGNTYVAYIIGD